MGKAEGEKKEIVEFCLKMHNWTTENLKAGIKADVIPKQFLQMFKDAGYEKNYVYGPCHGTGMIEVEAPWMETSSEYMLQKNMTFQVDTFVSGSTFGCRWEKGIAIKEGGVESYTDYLEKHGLIELGF
jgi:Xaa-Pro aminopeptidase